MEELIEKFIKTWYRSGITPEYQFSNLSQTEKRQMKEDLKELLSEYSVIIVKNQHEYDVCVDPTEVLSRYIK